MSLWTWYSVRSIWNVVIHGINNIIAVHITAIICAIYANDTFLTAKDVSELCYHIFNFDILRKLLLSDL